MSYSRIEKMGGNRRDCFELYSKFEGYKYILVTMAVIIAMLTFWKVTKLVNANGSWLYIGTEEFEKEMIIGPFAHMLIFAKALFIFLYLISAKSKHKIITYSALVLLGASIFSMMVKYHLLWLIMIVFFINNLVKPKKIQIRRLVRISFVLSLLLVFYFIFLSFFWQTFSFTNDKLWIFFYKTFINYFLTGPIVLNQWLDVPGIKPDWTLFTVILNYIKVIMGNPMRIDAIPLMTNGFVSVIPGISLNIGTSFGVYYLIGGLPFTLFITVVVSIISYFVYIRGLQLNGMLFLFFTWFFLTLNTLNFFGQYFTLLSFFEFPIYFIVLILIFNFFVRLKKIRI